MRTAILRLLIPISLIAVQVSAEAQAKPDPSPVARPNFAGTWLFTTGENGRGGPGRGGFNLGQEFTVKQDDKTITVDAKPNLGGPRQYVYNLDGSVTQDELKSNSKLSWDGAKLVITTDGQPPRTQTWSLEANGGRLTVVSILTAGNDTVTTTAIYQKK